MTEHVHKWKPHMHLDGCHYYTNNYNCDCGAELSVRGERQMVSRGKIMPGVYMASDTCDRCTALIGGARRRPTLHFIRERNGGWFRRLRDGRVVTP